MYFFVLALPLKVWSIYKAFEVTAPTIALV